MDKAARAVAYQQAYLDDYDFEQVQVAQRQRCVLDVLRRAAPARIVEVGCGIDPLMKRAVEADLGFARWVVVEPGERFLAAARAAAGDDKRFRVQEGFFEDVVDRLLAEEGPADMVLLSGLLNEIADPAVIVNAARRMAGSAGVVHVNVPNALSMHRRLARAMGLIADERTLTERNLALKQFHVFDPDRLRALVEAAGLRVTETGGFFVKPFTHGQMSRIREVLTPEILDGLWVLGRELPELASEIYVNAMAR
jgi:SAM-dependent methyltransferase